MVIISWKLYYDITWGHTKKKQQVYRYWKFYFALNLIAVLHTGYIFIDRTESNTVLTKSVYAVAFGIYLHGNMCSRKISRFSRVLRLWIVHKIIMLFLYPLYMPWKLFHFFFFFRKKKVSRYFLNFYVFCFVAIIYSSRKITLKLNTYYIRIQYYRDFEA